MEFLLRLSKKLIRILAEACAVVVCVAVSAELLFRLSFWLALTPMAQEEFHYKFLLMGRIQGFWLQNKQESPFVPPFRTFANRDFQDLSRLRWIFENSRLPSSRTWTSYDFLQAPERRDQTAYTIHSNALGFRGREVRAEKKPGTFRIVVLGSYQAFGHGVNDDETYSARLEVELNRRYGRRGRRFEVWNGGRHASTAIVGLARLRFEVFQYKPDLLIIDYGMVDNNVWDDDFFPAPMGIPDRGGGGLLKRPFRSLLPYLENSYLIANVRARILLRTDEKRVADFEGVLSQMASLARQHHVPILFIRQLPAVNFSHRSYLTPTLVDPEQLVDVREVFRMSPRPRTFDSWNTGWTGEIHDYRVQQFLPFQYYDFLLDYFQLNSEGHRVLATELAQRIHKLTLKAVQ